jgi:hypothetical protein
LAPIKQNYNNTNKNKYKKNINDNNNNDNDNDKTDNDSHVQIKIRVSSLQQEVVPVIEGISDYRKIAHTGKENKNDK